MSVLDTALRKQLDRAIVQARDAAEEAAAKALLALGVGEGRVPRTHARNVEHLRRRLLAVRSRLGGQSDLVQACAYEHWHRMLFARFLAENDLLIHPEHNVPVTLEECADLAREQGEDDQWAVAARFAAAMLPGIFPQDDPLLQVRLAPEDRQQLERLVEELPQEVFTSDDGLGWTYQFWQTKRKKEVNASGLPVRGADLAAVTQLFTEHYMVQFLLQNTLGAWWLSLHPDSALKGEWLYYRLEVQHDFSAWPQAVAEVRIIDPCCGSGHFLVEAFAMLLAMHWEEGRVTAEAIELILGQNLYGLEIDARCVQIGAFALALSAWKAGYPLDRELPVPNVACSGLPLGASEDEWHALANGDADLAHALVSLHELFANAGEIGSLLDVSQTTQTLQFADTQVVLDHLAKALRRERNMADPVAGVFGSFVNGGLRALEMLRGKYHLAVTNPPFLLRGKQADDLRRFCALQFPLSKKGLATSFLERCRAFSLPGGCYALVNPQDWVFLGSDRRLRRRILSEQAIRFVAMLGPKAFVTPLWDFNLGLFAIANATPLDSGVLCGVDAMPYRNPAAKGEALRALPVAIREQLAQLRNPDSRIVLSEAGEGVLLAKWADALQGISTTDYPRFGRCFWEMPSVPEEWAYEQSTVADSVEYGGREHVILWQQGAGQLRSLANAGVAAIRGSAAWGKRGIAVSQMQGLPVTVYTGELFDANCAAVVPKEPSHLPAIWAFCKSADFARSVRAIDQSLKVTNATLVKVPFDLAHWQAVAEQMGPLPKPHSEDPTQWLFKGNVEGSEAPLQVAVARLLGYRWPEQPERDELADLADPDGIACLPAVLRESPAVDRLRGVLRTAYGKEWNLHTDHELLEQVGYGGKGLEVWLRDGFFEQHAKLFHKRPFIWHIWDGRRDGFSALVNYHSLDRAKLEKLIYSYLGEWIARQQAEARAGTPGAEARSDAAQKLREKLELILKGEPPHDIYVRWKDLHEQPMGWEPDLNDGVRLNIRPFVEAKILRAKFTIGWKKDRGRNPDGTERFNDRHHTIAEKHAAREAAMPDHKKPLKVPLKKRRDR